MTRGTTSRRCTESASWRLGRPARTRNTPTDGAWQDATQVHGAQAYAEAVLNQQRAEEGLKPGGPPAGAAYHSDEDAEIVQRLRSRAARAQGASQQVGSSDGQQRPSPPCKTF